MTVTDSCVGSGTLDAAFFARCPPVPNGDTTCPSPGHPSKCFVSMDKKEREELPDEEQLGSRGNPELEVGESDRPLNLEDDSDDPKPISIAGIPLSDLVVPPDQLGQIDGPSVQLSFANG